MASPEPGRLLYAFRDQPLRSLYLTYANISLYLFRLPWWYLKSLLPAWRPRRSWSLRRCIDVYTLRYNCSLETRVDGIRGPPNHLSLDDAEETRGVWIEPVPKHYIFGDVKTWAEQASVEPERIPGYWIHHPDSTTQTNAAATQPGERVLLFLHGGGYTAMSAHPADPTASLARALLDALGAVGVTSAFSPEYRLSRAAPLPPAHPFPAALLDALAGYVHLVELGSRPQDVLVAGDSAGGNLALALMRFLRDLARSHDDVSAPGSAVDDSSLGIPGALILLSPWADLGVGQRAPHPESSYRICVASDFLSGPHSEYDTYAVRAYVGQLGARAAAANAYVSPASPDAEDARFAGFPPTFIAAGDAEVDRDSIRRLRDKMVADMGEGDKGITYHEGVDAIHDFLVFAWHEPQRKHALAEISAWAQHVLR